MTDPPFRMTRLDELDRIPGEFETIPVRLPLGIRAFGVNAYGAQTPGGRVIEEHDELGPGAGRHEELYVVLSGRARFTLDEEEVDAPAGTLVFVRDPGVRRGAVAQEAGTTVLVVGGAPGEAFEPSPWDGYRAKEYAKAAEILAAALERHPDNANVLYNLACVESLGGQHGEALAHLGRAIELDPRAREWARADADLDPIRSAPGFPG